MNILLFKKVSCNQITLNAINIQLFKKVLLENNLKLKLSKFFLINIYLVN